MKIGNFFLHNPKMGHTRAVQNRWARVFEETVTSHCRVRLILAQLFRELAEDGTCVSHNIEKISNLCMLCPSHVVTTPVHRHHTSCHSSRMFLFTPMEQQPLVGQAHLVDEASRSHSVIYVILGRIPLDE